MRRPRRRWHPQMSTCRVCENIVLLSRLCTTTGYAATRHRTVDGNNIRHYILHPRPTSISIRALMPASLHGRCFSAEQCRRTAERMGYIDGGLEGLLLTSGTTVTYQPQPPQLSGPTSTNPYTFPCTGQRGPSNYDVRSEND